jgi:glycoside/pentoside/hexuronide:cation symporter, GPH family
MAGSVGSSRGYVKTTKAITTTDTVNYAMGSFGTGVFSTVPAVLLLYFCTETLQISGSVAAALILIPKLWSILWDPFVGRWSDRSKNIWGRRRPFMIAGIIGMVIAFVLLFNVPNLSHSTTIMWVGVCYFALASLFSLYAVPYIALPAEISHDQTSLARLVSWRMVIVMIGILAGAAGAPMLVESGGGGRAGYGFMGWVIATCCLIIMALPLAMLRGRDMPAKAPPAGDATVGLISDIKSVLANVRFRRLAIAYLVQATAFGAFSAIIPYVVTKGFGKTDGEIGTALGIYILATIVAVPAWSALGKKLGLRRALNLASLIYAFGALLIGILVLTQASWTTALLVLAIVGIPFAGLQVLPFTLIGDVIRAEGADCEGRYTGVWTATEKLGLSMGPALVGVALSMAGDHQIVGIGVFLCLIPTLLCLLSLPFVTTADTLIGTPK